MVVNICCECNKWIRGQVAKDGVLCDECKGKGGIELYVKKAIEKRLLDIQNKESFLRDGLNHLTEQLRIGEANLDTLLEEKKQLKEFLRDS